MAYSDKMVVVLKHDGKVLRDVQGTVKLPFGSEYTVLVKNLNSVRGAIALDIDGKDALSGYRIILEANEEFELRGFMEPDGVVRHAFRSIQKTQEIAAHRGDRIDDGLLRVTFEFERPSEPAVSPYINTAPWFKVIGGTTTANRPASSNGFSSFSTPDVSWFVSQEPAYMARAFCAEDTSEPAPEEVITVKGSDQHQTFGVTSFSGDGVKHVIVFKLVGEAAEKPVQAPVYVKTKIECPTCGRPCKSHFKFCTNCGTRLV